MEEIIPILGSRYSYPSEPVVPLNAVQLAARQDVLGKLASGEYPLESVPCAICGRSVFELLSKTDRYALPVDVVICCECGLVQTNPRMTEDAYGDFYQNHYRKLYGGVPTPGAEHFQQLYKRGSDFYEYLRSQGYLADVAASTVVEVGCAGGGILQFFKEQGVQVYGCDLDHNYIQYGRDQGLELTAGTLDHIVLPRPADVIIYADVFEHLLDLECELDSIHSALAPDGVVLVQAPGVKNTSHADLLLKLQNAHTYYFSLRTLRNTFEAGSFTLIDGGEGIRALFRKASESSHTYTSDYDKTIRSLKRIEYLRGRIPLMRVIGALKRSPFQRLLAPLYRWFVGTE